MAFKKKSRFASLVLISNGIGAKGWRWKAAGPCQAQNEDAVPITLPSNERPDVALTPP